MLGAYSTAMSHICCVLHILFGNYIPKNKLFDVKHM